MKLLLLTIALLLFILTPSIAKIKNGYAKKLEAAEQSIKNLNIISKGDLSEEKRLFLHKRVKFAQKETKRIRVLFEKTNELIYLFYVVHPNLYFQIDTIKDKQGNNTDVYIRAVDKSFLKGKWNGTTNIDQSSNNPNVYRSIYGDYSVSVNILYRYCQQSLKYLIHELGHVKYQVPNLAEYICLYQKYYQNQYFTRKNIGHFRSDPSHKSVVKTVKEFRSVLITYKRNRKTSDYVTKANPFKEL